MKLSLSLLSAAIIAVCLYGNSYAEDRNITIEATDTTSEWVMMFDRGVAAGIRLNSACKDSDYVDLDLNGEGFKVCRSFKSFMASDQFQGSPSAFQLGYLTAMK